MKQVLLSADGPISVFSVPDQVADNLEQYCNEFCCNWLPKSPDAAKYRVSSGDQVVMCYNEKDFIEYLNQYVCDQQSTLVETIRLNGWEDELPEAYRDLPYFYF